MSDIDGSARSENGESTGIIEASGVFRAELDLEEKTKNVSTQVLQMTRSQKGDLPLRQRTLGESQWDR